MISTTSRQNAALIALSLWFISSRPVGAEELPSMATPNTVEASVTNTITASQFSSNGEQLDAHIFSSHLDLETYFENQGGQTTGLKFDTLHLKEGLGFGSNETLQTRLGLGFAQLQLESAATTQFLEADLELRKKWSDKFDIFAKLSRSEFAELFETLGSFQEKLSGEALKAGANWRLATRLRAQFNHQSFWLNDSNNRSDDDLSLLYGISPDWPWIWVGAGVENISNSLATAAYWSPRQFIDYGPRVDIAFPLGEKLTAAFALNLNHFKDIDYGEGNGYYFLGKLTYGEENRVKVDLSWEQIQSKQESSNWFSQAIRIGVVCPF